MRTAYTYWILLCLLLLSSTAWAAPSGKTENEPPKPNNPFAFTSFIDYRPKSSHFPSSLREITDALEEGDRLSASGQKDSAQERYEHAIEVADALRRDMNRSLEDQLWFLRGFAHENLSQEQKAKSDYEKALEVRPNNLLARFRHALLLKQANNCEKAISEFQEVEWAVAELAYEMNYLEGDCFMTLGKKEEGMRQFEKAYKKRNTFIPVVKRLLAIHQEQLETTASPGERTAIENQISQDLKTITKGAPGDREASIALTKMLLNVKDPVLEKAKIDQAESLAKKGAEGSHFEDDVFVRLLAEAQLKKGLLDDAAAVIEKGLKQKPRSSELAIAQQQLKIERALKTTAVPDAPK